MDGSMLGLGGNFKHRMTIIAYLFADRLDRWYMTLNPKKNTDNVCQHKLRNENGRKMNGEMTLGEPTL